MPDNIEAITERQVFTRALVALGAAESKPGDPIRFIASTSAVARDGMVIDATAWQLDPYRSNPVVLWSHDYTSAPLGKANAYTEGGNLVCDISFDQEDPAARMVEGKYRRGFLNALSVGWRTHEIKQGAMKNDPPRITRAELLEISCVPVPADPGALIERQARGLADLQKQLAPFASALLSDADESVNGDSFEASAVALMRLYTPGDQMPEADRKRQYNRAAAAYRRLGKTAPEYMTLAELDGLDLATVRGLFLEGEPSLIPFLFADERAGAMLSARNKRDLQQAMDCKRQAMDLVGGVLKRAAAMPDPEADPNESEDPATDSVDSEDSSGNENVTIEIIARDEQPNIESAPADPKVEGLRAIFNALQKGI